MRIMLMLKEYAVHFILSYSVRRTTYTVRTLYAVHSTVCSVLHSLHVRHTQCTLYAVHYIAHTPCAIRDEYDVRYRLYVYVICRTLYDTVAYTTYTVRHIAYIVHTIRVRRTVYIVRHICIS